MTTDRDALYALLATTTRAASSLQAAVAATDKHLNNTVEPTCSCEQTKLTYDGPQVDCDVHGLPSAAFEAGRRQGAQEERDAAELRAKRGSVLMSKSDLIELFKGAGYGTSYGTSEGKSEKADEYSFEVGSNQASLEDESEGRRGPGEPADADQMAMSWEDFQ